MAIRGIVCSTVILKTFRRALLLLGIIFVWLTVSITRPPTTVALPISRLQSCRRKGEHIVNIGSSLL